jgi:hypothetical protein
LERIVQIPQPTTTPQPAVPSARAIALSNQRKTVLSHYTLAQQNAALLLYNLVKNHPGTGGSRRASTFLLSLYNGGRFQFDLTDLRMFDDDTLAAAFVVLEMDARRCWCEIHSLLDAILGGNANVGAEFEHWAYDLGLKGRCKKNQLPMLPPETQQ